MPSGIFKRTEFHRKINSLAHKGQIPWNKGKKLSEEHKRKIGLSNEGENGSNWKGGIDFLPYPINFNLRLKRYIKNRDNYKCQLCGVPITECSQLQAHHIDYNKKNISDVNLISLCPQCHGKTNFNRKYWEEYFTQLMISEIKILKY